MDGSIDYSTESSILRVRIVTHCIHTAPIYVHS